jgi:hypothetical protein
MARVGQDGRMLDGFKRGDYKKEARGATALPMSGSLGMTTA